MNTTLDELESPVLSPYASADFNASFWHELRYLANDVAALLGDSLIAVVLGGGFGRSEGCVAWADEHEIPYNDVDLFLITRTPFPTNMGKLHHLAARYEHRLKIAVDFSRPQTPAMIAKWQPLLMWQELVNGHRVLYGPEDVLHRHVNASVLAELPSVEASRLMLNRGAGLLWAARVALGLDETPDATFVARNYFKCCQALGDATLISFGRYCSDPGNKADRLAELVRGNEAIQKLSVLERFQASVAFRRSPYPDTSVTIKDLHLAAAQWCGVLLWLESRRLGRNFSSIEQYLGWAGLREANEGSRMRLFASNLRRRRLGWQHPREAVYRSLPASLQQLGESDPEFAGTSLPALRMWQGAQ